MTINAGYKAYLVRVWPGTDGGSWRVVAEDAQSGDRIQFTSLNGLVNFLATGIVTRRPTCQADAHWTQPALQSNRSKTKTSSTEEPNRTWRYHDEFSYVED